MKEKEETGKKVVEVYDNFPDDELVISKNKIYLLIRLLDETREILKSLEGHSLLKHDLKILKETFDSILTNDGIDRYLEKAKHRKKDFETRLEIQKEINGED